MNYEELINSLEPEKIVQLMQKLGASYYVETDKYLAFPTICHNEEADDASIKLYYYKDNKFFYCYTECGGMSIFQFLTHYYETRQIDYDWYTDIYQVIASCGDFSLKEGFENPKREKKHTRYMKKEKVELPEYPEKVLEVFYKKYPKEWLLDGITEAAMDKFNILYSPTRNKIIIPHYDVNNRLVGIRGRALDDWEVETVGKYSPVKIEQTWYSHKTSLNLYGLNISKNNIINNGIVYLFESEKSCLQLEGFSKDNCGVAVCGSNFNKYQLNILMRECHPKEIVICFDKEEKKGEDSYFNKLYGIGNKYKKYCNFSFVYDRENILNMKDSPTDKGEEVFMRLLQKRVIVK